MAKEDLPLGERVALMIESSDDTWVDWDGRVYQTIDVSADFEVIGTSVECMVWTTALSAQQEVITAGAAEEIYLYKVLVSPAANATCAVGITGAATQIGLVQNPRLGSQYTMLDCHPNYYAIATDSHFYITNATGVEMTFIITYEKV